MAGFSPVRNQSNSDYGGKLETYSVDAAHATLLAIGDVVTVTSASDSEGLQGVDAAVAAGPVTGVVAGFEPDFANENLNTTGLAASTAGKARVHIDPQMIYEAEIANAALVAANVGLNIDIVATAATQTGGIVNSNMTVNGSSAAVTATLPFRIIGLVPAEDGTIGAIGSKALVRPNNTYYKAGVAAQA